MVDRAEKTLDALKLAIQGKTSTPISTILMGMLEKRMEMAKLEVPTDDSLGSSIAVSLYSRIS